MAVDATKAHAVHKAMADKLTMVRESARPEFTSGIPPAWLRILLELIEELINLHKPSGPAPTATPAAQPAPSQHIGSAQDSQGHSPTVVTPIPAAEAAKMVPGGATVPPHSPTPAPAHGHTPVPPMAPVRELPTSSKEDDDSGTKKGRGR